MSNIRDRIKRYGTGVRGEGLNHSSLSLQSEPAIVMEGVGNNDPRPGDCPPVSWSTVELERDLGGSDNYTTRRERDPRVLHPHAYKRAGPGSSQERAHAGRKKVGHVDPPRSESDIETPPTPSISQDDESESTWTTPFRSPPLTDDVTNQVVIGAVTSEDKSDWKHAASSAAKLTLRTVREVSDAFPPLKYIAGGLCSILENCEVCSPHRSLDPRCPPFSQPTKVNKQTIESLGYRIKALDSLCGPAEGDVKEETRRRKLGQ